MPPIAIKFRGNKSFVAFSNLGDTESLTNTWKVCSKVASYLEQGQRLENLSWRLWHLQNLMVDTDNARSKREFKKLSKTMSDKLDKDKGRSIEELEAPDFKSNHSSDLIRQRAVEKEKHREASKAGTIKRTHFTFSLEQPHGPATANAPVKKPDFKPSNEFRRAKRAAQEEEAEIADDEGNDYHAVPHHGAGRRKPSDPDAAGTLKFPSLFSDDFGPSAMLFPAPTFTPSMNYGEGVGATSNSGFSIARPTIVVPLDEILGSVNYEDDDSMWSDASPPPPIVHHHHHHHTHHRPDVVMQVADTVSDSASVSDSMNDDSSDSDYEVDLMSTSKLSHVPPINAHTSKLNQEALRRSSTPTMRPHLAVKTQPLKTATGRMQITTKASSTRLNAAAMAVSAATPRIVAPAPRSAASNNAPGGVKAECVNCGATATPLWRRGLNDELNCNACGLYSKLHKRPRPKTMRNSNNSNNNNTNNHNNTTANAEARASASTSAAATVHQPRHEPPEVVVAQCYNCHTTTTPLWRKDDEGKTVCNACGLYHKLHGSARPISMKSDVIRKRSRHDARRNNAQTIAETPSASPGASRRPSPAAERSPTLAPDSTTQMANFSDYDYTSESDYHSSHSQSELMSALGQDNNQHMHYTPQGHYMNNSNYSFPGPYHPDYLMQHYVPPDALPFPPESGSQGQIVERTNKRRRMSVDSASEPPSSAVSYNSYNDGWSSSRSSVSNHSQRPSMEFPFQQYPDYNILHGPNNSNTNNPNNNGNSGNNGNNSNNNALRVPANNTFWHPPMTAQANSPQFSIHPPMLPPDDWPMGSLHPPMMLPHEDSYMSNFHPPMMLPQDDDHLFSSFTNQNNHDSSSLNNNTNNNSNSQNANSHSQNNYQHSGQNYYSTSY